MERLTKTIHKLFILEIRHDFKTILENKLALCIDKQAQNPEKLRMRTMILNLFLHN